MRFQEYKDIPMRFTYNVCISEIDTKTRFQGYRIALRFTYNVRISEIDTKTRL